MEAVPSAVAARTRSALLEQAPAQVVVGVLCGLAWAAALRGWMAQLAGDESRFSWLTVALVLLPGAAVGGLLGWAARTRATRTRTARWLAWSPALFASALLDPTIFRALVTNGEGSGALMVVLTAVAGGFVLGRHRWSVLRGLAAVVLAAGLLLLTAIGTMAGPVTTARGAWVCLYGLVLMVLLCLASALPYPPRPVASWRGSAAAAASVGVLCGLAWASGLRSFMAQVAAPDSHVTWALTFGFILAPAAVVGGLLGWVAHLRSHGDGRFRRRLLWSPMLFAAVLFSDLNPLGILENGLGGGAVAVPLLGIAGAYALAGRGPRWTRVTTGLVALAAVPLWALTATAVGGPEFALSHPLGLWAAVLYWSLLARLSVAAALPLREAAGSAVRAGRAGRAEIRTPLQSQQPQLPQI